MVMTWSFEPAASGTAVNVSADNVPKGIKKSDHEAGLKSSVNNLARFLGRD
jgi:Activator of Hsp90 ATPase homolog 1-like protein